MPYIMTDYSILCEQLQSLAESERLWLPVLSNAASLLYTTMKKLNWAGFYLEERGSLVLGPFQGKPACVRIPYGKGVCGTAWELEKVMRISDVHTFPGHIMCDSDSVSEIVLPIRKNGKVVGVLDIDSPVKDRFSEQDEEGLLQFVRVLEENTDWRKSSFS